MQIAPESARFAPSSKSCVPKTCEEFKEQRRKSTVQQLLPQQIVYLRFRTSKKYLFRMIKHHKLVFIKNKTESL